MRLSKTSIRYTKLYIDNMVFNQNFLIILFVLFFIAWISLHQIGCFFEKSHTEKFVPKKQKPLVHTQ